MIEIRMTGMCDGCEEADLELVYEPNIHNRLTGEITKRGWSVLCKHDRACQVMRKKTQEGMK